MLLLTERVLTQGALPTDLNPGQGFNQTT